MRATRQCLICVSDFKTKTTSMRKTCSHKCSMEYRNGPLSKIRHKLWYGQPESKERRREYLDRPAVKEKLKLLRASPEGRARQKRYYSKHYSLYGNKRRSV